MEIDELQPESDCDGNLLKQNYPISKGITAIRKDKISGFY